MELLRELSALQHERGYLDDACLQELSQRRNVPLYRLQGLVSFYPHFRKTPPPAACVHVCRDLSCWMRGSSGLAADLRHQFADQTDVEVTEVSCIGRCDFAPAVSINDICLPQNDVLDRDQLLAQINDPRSLTEVDVVPRSRVYRCDPYTAQAGGPEPYSLLKNLVANGQNIGEVCLSRLKESKLRGMGGAGFPTGTKWSLVAQEPANPKYVIVNADESEPGTFKDREILEQLPHLVIEGVVLAALTIGAEQAIVYLRHEYESARKVLEAEIQRARALGILGPNAAGSVRTVELEIFVSPGGYILGEETALLQALEDERGEPRNKPPYPGTQGLWGKPTLINNVETFALATCIIHRGVDWWRSQGKAPHQGLKFVSISGDVARPGVYEIPLGTTLLEFIELAGGMADGKQLFAFLPGGASSNFLPAMHADVPLDFDSLQQRGSMLGSGAIVIIAEGTDLFALATNIVAFFRNESCGKCVPCRLGSHKAVELLEAVQAGTSPSSDLAILPELGETLTQTSICGLGQVALNPILSMLKHFPELVPA